MPSVGLIINFGDYAANDKHEKNSILRHAYGAFDDI